MKDTSMADSECRLPWKRVIRPIACASLLLPSACGWGLGEPFQVSSVAVLDHLDLKTILPWYAQADAKRPPVGLLRVEVLSPINLVTFAKEHGFSVAYDAYYCGAKDEPHRTVSTAVYPRVGEFEIANAYSAPQSALESARERDGQIRYAFYVPLDEPPFGDVYRELTKKSNIASPLYDKSNRADLCFEIRGGDMLGRSYTSSPIVVTRSDILAAVAHRR